MCKVYIYIYIWLLKLNLYLSISTALMRPRRPKQYCLQLDIALWCKNQIEHSIWDESLLFCNCACSLEYSSLHSRPQRLRSIWPAPWIETSGRLQSVLVTDWSDANTIKSDKPEKKHEAWRKGTNKANFCGNVRLPYSQGKYYKQKPSVRFNWKAMKEGLGQALEIVSVIKISLAIVFHLECAELTKVQEFLKMVLRSVRKPKRSRLFDPSEGRLYKKARLPPLHQVLEVRKKRARSAACNLCYAHFCY